MKKHYLFLAICCMASGLLAQSPSPFDLHRKLVQKSSQLTPDLLHPEIGLFNGQKPLTLTPLTLPYNLVDSTYEYTWNELDQNWNIRLKMFIENDCVIGRPSVVLIQVDSSGNGIFSNETKIQYQYFDTDNLQKTEYFRWNPAQQTWEQFLLTSYVRPNEPLEEMIRFWDEASNTLIGGMRTAYSYDNNDKLERSENYDLDIPTNSWVLGSRRTYTYTNGLNTKILEEIYQPASNSWLPSERITNTYDDNGHLLTHTIEYDYGNGLITEYKDTFTYNASGQLIEKIQQYYTGFALENYIRETYQYYDNGVTEFTDRHLWLPNQQDWLWNGQMVLREDGRLNFLWSKYFTSDTSSQLDGGFQTRRFYTSEGLYDYTLMEKFVPQGLEEWVPLHRITLAYNDDNRLMEEVYQNWDEAQMAFINDFRYYYFNTGCLFSAAEDISPAESNYCLHANPLRPGQAIQCPTLPQSDEALTLTLYGMAGQLLHRQAFWPGGSFQPTQPLAPGIYLLDIRTEKGSSVHRAKVVVE